MTTSKKSPPDAASGTRRRTVLAGGMASTMAAALGMSPSAQAARLPLGFTPNIVFLLTDDGPRNSYSEVENAFPVVSNGYQGSWLSYPNASCNDPLCAPGRAATLSGLVSQHHGVLDNQSGQRLDLRNTWVTALQRAGYRCGGYGKLINGWGVDFGSTTKVPPGFADFHMLVSEPAYFNYVLNDNGKPTTYGSRDTNSRDTDYLTDVNRLQIIDFIKDNERTRPGRPWAVYWAPNAPHTDGGVAPIPPARYENTDVPLIDPPNFNTGPQSQMPWLGQAQKDSPLDVEVVHYEHRRALRALMAVNEGLKDIIDELIQSDLLDRTVIIVATDNSHIYGAYGLQDKGTSFEDSLNNLLRIRYPGAPDGAERLQAVSNIDMAPFLCELAGASMRRRVDGQSFVPTLLNAKAPFREAAPICHAKDGPGTPAFDGLRFPDRKVVVGRQGGSAQGEKWSHNLLTDPWELQAKPPTPSDLAKLQAMLDSF